MIKKVLIQKDKVKGTQKYVLTDGANYEKNKTQLVNCNYSRRTLDLHINLGEQSLKIILENFKYYFSTY